MLYELICGRLPFAGPSVNEYLIQHVTVPAAVAAAGRARDPAGRDAGRDRAALPGKGSGGTVSVGGAAGAPVPGARARRRDRVHRHRQLPGRPAANGARAPSRGGDAGHDGPGPGPAAGAGRGRGDLASAPPGAGRGRASCARAYLGPDRAAPVPPPLPVRRRPCCSSRIRRAPRCGRSTTTAAPRELLGTTPLRRSIARSADEITFEIRLDGYDTMRVPTPATTDRTVNVEPEASPRRQRRNHAAKAGRAAAPRADPRADDSNPYAREKTIDPFH